jgi:TonB family protein
MTRAVIAAAAWFLASAAQGEPARITNPDFAKRPTYKDLMAVFPAEAMKHGVDGRAKIECVVDVHGFLTDCVVVDETPTGFGFGAAALLVAQRIQLKPMLRNGVPVGGAKWATYISFVGAAAPAGSRPAGDSSVPSVTVARPDQTVWDRAPSAAEMQAAYPRSAAETAVLGRVVIRCSVNLDGSLSACATMHEDPEGHGFARAARSLAHSFKFAIEAAPPEYAGKFSVDIPMTFAPVRAEPGSLAKPNWIRTISAEKTQQLFPGKAADAGLTTGRAVLDCIASQTGMMTNCRVVSEEPTGMDFGSAAVQVASVMGVNPWTDDGEPVDGRHVQFALRLNRAPDAPAGAK